MGAKKGYDLLKKKSDALKKAFRSILQKIVESKVRMGVDYRDARMGMAEANFAAGDFSRAVEDSASEWTPVRLSKKEENIENPHQCITYEDLYNTNHRDLSSTVLFTLLLVQNQV